MLRTKEQFVEALKNLQFFGGLQSTGELDDATVELISKPRCGVQDVSPGFRTKREARVQLRVKRYSLQGQRWSRTSLTWSLETGLAPSVLPRDSVRRELSTALQVWASHSRLQFTEVWPGTGADIEVFFHSGYHGDGYPFDGPGSVLAHAFFPGGDRGGDVHFDLEEVWSEERVMKRQETSLFAVAVHEVGLVECTDS